MNDNAKVFSIVVVILGFFALVLSCCCLSSVGFYRWSIPPSLDEKGVRQSAPKPEGPILLVSGDKVFRRNTLVRVSLWGGVIEPEVSGSTNGLSIDPGRYALVVGAEQRKSDAPYFDPREKPQLVRVRWFPQEWSTWPILWHKVKIESFESTIHPDSLKPLEVER